MNNPGQPRSISNDDDDVPLGTPNPLQSPSPSEHRLSNNSTDSSNTSNSNTSTSSDQQKFTIESTSTTRPSKRDFRKVKMIGRGNVGRVYLVEKEHAYYSMKVIPKRLISSPTKEQRVEGEREILDDLDHPFIVRLFHSFETPFYYLYVMTYCPGGDFWHILQRQRGKCFSEKTAKFYLAEVVCALEYLHMEGIVYRDLKPENILMTEDGHIKLSDFDLSKQHEEDEKPRIKTSLFGEDEIVVEPTEFHSYSFVGTNEYLAPEIISKDGHSASVDWWTLGVLMYEFLYGCNPFAAATVQETHENIQKGIYSFPKKHFNKVSRDAKDLIKELLDVDSEDRLGSKYGATEIKNHEFFEDIKFVLIRNMTPPIQPKLKGIEDTSCFPTFQEYDDDVPDDWGREEERKLKKKMNDGRRKKRKEKVERNDEEEW